MHNKYSRLTKIHHKQASKHKIRFQLLSFLHSSQIPETFDFAELCSFLKHLKSDKNKEISMTFILRGLWNYSETLKSIHEVVLDKIILRYSFFSFE
jgi:hypothetical protein